MEDDVIDKTEAAAMVAAIDIGSNAIRMVVAQVLPDGHVEVLERTQRAVRLGQDTFVSGRISSRGMSAAIAILSDYQRLLQTYPVGQMRAVATSAVREATNADPFVDRIYTSCGLDVEVIDPSEESRLTVSAVRKALGGAPEIHCDDALIADVGGGSALLTVLHAGDIVASESQRLGSVRLQEVLATAGETPGRAARLIRHQIGGLLGVITGSLHLDKVRAFVAAGGDARFVAHQIGEPTESPELHTVKLKAFDRLVSQCARLSVEQIARRYDLPYPDAETLVPALLVFQGLVHATGAERIVVPETSMRDGLLLDLARSVTGQQDEQLTGSILQSARVIGEKYHCDTAHAEHVAVLAERLFDAFRAEHGLGSRYRLLLRVAALLHEVGGFVSGRAHHKHSYYLLANAEIFGLRQEELQIVALVARYHRRSVPKVSHIEYMSMPRENRMVVSKLAAFLRVADALERGHAQQVRQFDLDRQGDDLVLSVRGVTDLALERRALAQKADLFEDVFGMKIRLEEAPLGQVDKQAGNSIG